MKTLSSKIVLVFLIFEVTALAAPKVEFNLEDPYENELGPNKRTKDEDPGFFLTAGQRILDSLDGPVTKLQKHREAPAREHRFQPKNELLKEMLKYYQRSQVPEEGLQSLKVRGNTTDKQIRYYKKNPEKLAMDLFRRIQYARTHQLGLTQLEDVFVLQNAYRTKGTDLIEALVQKNDWLNFVHAPRGPEVPFPIHTVTVFKDRVSNMSLSRRVDMLPTTIRWSQHLPQRMKPVRLPSAAVAHQHRHCLRVPSGRYAGHYHSLHFGGPHKAGHPDVSWWTGIFHQRAMKPRRVAVLVSVSADMKDSDSQRGRGYRSCMRFRSLENLVHSRWEGMSYALIPFAEGVLGINERERPPFYQWKKHREQMVKELREWGCAYRTAASHTPWNTRKMVKQLLDQVFAGTYAYGDSVIVLLSRLDPHYAQWSELSKKSGGVQSFASSSGILISMDMALRAK